MSLYLCEGHIEITSIWSKNLTIYILRLCLVCGENLERRHYGRRGRMDASAIHARRLNAKEVLTPQRNGDFIFPVTDGTVKIFG